MKFKRIKSYLQLFNKTTFCLSFLLLFNFTISSQENVLSFSHQSADEIIQMLEDTFDIVFNYDNSIFENSSERHTFSLDYDLDKSIKSLALILDKEIVSLEKRLFVISNTPQSSKKLEDTKWTIRVIDEEGSPLFGCVTEFVGLNHFLETDFEGLVTIEGIFAGQQKLKLKLLGHESISLFINTLDSHKINVVKLPKFQHFLGEIIIRDNIKSIELETLGQAKINPNAILDAGSIDNDGLSISKSIAGIYNSSESINDLQIRGGPPDQTNISWNDIQLFQTSLFYGKISSTNPLMTDEIVINKDGGHASDDSNAAGTIKLNNQQLDTINKVHLHTNLLYANVGANWNVFKNKLNIKAAYRKAFDNLFENQVFGNYINQSFQVGIVDEDAFYSDFYNLEDLQSFRQEFDFHDLSATLVFEPSAKTHFSLSFLDIRNRTSYIQEGDSLEAASLDILEIDNFGISSQLIHYWSTSFKSRLYGNISDYKYDYEGVSNYLDASDSYLTEQENNVKLQKYGLKNNLNFSKIGFEFGAEYSLWSARYSNMSSNQNVFDEFGLNDNNSFEVSGFLSSEIYLNSKFKMNVGVRLSDYSLIHKNELLWEPRLSLSYLFSKNFGVYGHYGAYHQVLNERNIFTAFQVDNGFWYLSDEGINSDNWIDVVRNKQLSLSTKYSRKGWVVDMSLYRKEITDLWTSAFTFTYEEDPYVFVDSQVYGLEFSIMKTLASYDIKATVDLVSDKIHFISGDKIKSPFFQPFRFLTLANFKHGSFFWSLQWQFAKGRYYSVPVSFTEKIDEFGEPYFSTDFNELQNQQGPDYHKLDLTMKYQFNVRDRAKFNLGTNISNVYDRRNVTRVYYLIDYKLETLNYSRVEQLGLPLTANFFVEFIF